MHGRGSGGMNRCMCVHVHTGWLVLWSEHVCICSCVYVHLHGNICMCNVVVLWWWNVAKVRRG